MLRKLFLSNINYIYTCIVSHRMLKNIIRILTTIKFRNVVERDVILYCNANNCQIKNVHQCYRRKQYIYQNIVYF